MKEVVKRSIGDSRIGGEKTKMSKWQQRSWTRLARSDSATNDQRADEHLWRMVAIVARERPPIWDGNEGSVQ